MLEPSHNALLPDIPHKRYFTIGEVGELCNVKPHVLRYWEQEFEQLSPMKRRGNRRYYQREDVLMIRQIRSLLYEQGYTISGARTQLQAESKRSERYSEKAIAVVEPNDTETLLAYQLKISQNMLNVVIKDMIRELEAVLVVLSHNHATKRVS